MNKDIICFNDNIFVEAVMVVAQSDILKALLYASEDGTYSFYYQNEEIENAQINVIVKELKKNGITLNDYTIKSVDEVIMSEDYDSFIYRNQDDCDEHYAQQSNL
jgi:hypothetical protein